MSTRESRRTFVAAEQTLPVFRVHGEPDFAVIPPFTARRGWYRVDLDHDAHIASFTLIALVPAEEAP